MQKQIQRLLEQLPQGEWWHETEHGELIPTLDLYLYLVYIADNAVNQYAQLIQEVKQR
jgi:hypothetical protein